MWACSCVFVETLVEKPPEGDEWIHEVKFNGYRSQIIIDHDVRIFTRNGHDWTAKYRDLASAAKRLGFESAAKAIFHLIDEAGIEGMVSKRRDSKYRSAPSST
ncbi:hypothetical protein JQK88_16120 [Mesorhizobium caraganae]|uniref:ATP-dependent DNA ligase n=1 Tax=Mesorhizobium caraganae TaxID=483206 RepID=UPI0017862B88|nr:hypothetical protein [Mesorhizobium caraganae]MBM2712746.1 hypothetical protein [Mesorhizobium caraganae]